MKVSFITTVFNEESNVEVFLQSLFSQTKMPEEIVIVDGGSRDMTLKRIKNYELRIKKDPSLRRVVIKIISKKGNRSMGRNEAIKNATGDVIVCSDFGCILDKNWIKNIAKEILRSARDDRSVDVVGGYYYPITNSIFEKCMAAYTCTMPDKIDKENFLPSSRSIAFKKSAWEKVGGYPENLDYCEDQIFAKRLKNQGFRFEFVQDAFVLWPQRKNLQEAFVQFFNYAKGDGQAYYFRPQTPFLFLRYFLGISLLIFAVVFKVFLILNSLVIILILYFLWSISKNYRYVRYWQAILILPILQITADIAVISGMTFGIHSGDKKK